MRGEVGGGAEARGVNGGEGLEAGEEDAKMLRATAAGVSTHMQRVEGAVEGGRGERTSYLLPRSRWVLVAQPCVSS